MLPAGDPVPPSEADRNNNRAAIDILETELLCDESLSETIKEDEEETVSSDSLNERKRLHTDEEEEDGNATEAVSDANKLRRIHEEEGKNELDGQGGNQDSEQGGNQESEVADEKDERNQVNYNGEEDKKEEDENEETKEEKEDETEELQQCSTAEQNERGEEESEQNEGKEDGENGEKEEEEKETEEEKQKAAAKGKRPSLEAITPIFSKPKQGEPSYTPEGYQTQNSSAKNDTELTNHELNNNNNNYDYHRDLAILRSMWHFKCNNGELPYPHSDELHNHIMDSIPTLNILGDDLTAKITAFEDDFNTVRILDGDNPEMAHPVELEIFDFSMRLWGNSEDNVGGI